MNEQKQEKGLKNVKNLFKWDGFKKEMVWILFFLALFYLVYAYQRDTEVCRNIVDNPCYYCAAYLMNNETLAGRDYMRRQTEPLENISYNFTEIMGNKENG